MLAWLRQRGILRRTARSLYGSIVTQARSPPFYAHWGVPDTPEGHFELISLHLVLALRRLGSEGAPGQALARALTEAFVVDLDDALREMTVGDLAVPRQVKHAIAVLHERYGTYARALAPGIQNGALETAIHTRLSALAGAQALDATRICAYIKETAQALERQPSAEVLDGHLAWPEVSAGG